MKNLSTQNPNNESLFPPEEAYLFLIRQISLWKPDLYISESTKSHSACYSCTKKNQLKLLSSLSFSFHLTLSLMMLGTHLFICCSHHLYSQSLLNESVWKASFLVGHVAAYWTFPLTSASDKWINRTLLEAKITGCSSLNWLHLIFMDTLIIQYKLDTNEKWLFSGWLNLFIVLKHFSAFCNNRLFWHARTPLFAH